MSGPESLARTVLRAYVWSVIAGSAALVSCAAVAMTIVVVGRDDRTARALARTLGSELANHHNDTLEQLDVLIEHELEEQQWFRRETGIWRDGRALGRERHDLVPWASRNDCSSAWLGGWYRVCVVHPDAATAITIASPGLPLLFAQRPYLLSLAMIALVVVTLLAVVGRRFLRRRFEPLLAFEKSVEALLPRAGARVSEAWGARELHTLAVAFNRLLERIDAVIEREQQFVSNAAHELRTPLTRIQGQIELVLNDALDSVDARHRLGLALRSARELARTMDALLALARDNVSLDVCSHLADICTDVVNATAESDRVSIVESDDDAIVRGEPTLLELVVRNLIANGLAYSGGAIEVAVVRHGDRCGIEVRDRGPGMPETLLTRISERFVRGPDSYKKAPGSGLGLAISDHIVRLHGGLLELRRRDGGGLVAALTLPAWSPSISPSAR